MEKIKVVCRIRPFTHNERLKQIKEGWEIDKLVDWIQAKDQSMHHHPFTFDKIFSPDNTNKDVYESCCQNIISNTMEGVDTTIFVYGQTGAGKTHTMLGPPNSFNFTGILFQSLQDIFHRVNSKQEGENFTINCSYIEIYNENVYDLLTKPENMKEGLQIFEDQNGKRFYVKGKTMVKIESLGEVEQILKYGETNRQYAQTYFNHKSSRSHTIFQINLRVSKITDQGESFIKESQINFVDLAGNERLLFEYKKRSQGINLRVRNKSVNLTDKQQNSNDFYNPNDQKKRMNESKHINKSLFFLTQVIYLTSKGQSQNFIPFWNSPLTKILRTSLGGNSRTLLILCVAPGITDFDITLSTLRFGRCAKKIENKIRPNVMSSYDKAAIQAIINQYEQKFSIFDDKIKQMEQNQLDFLSFWKDYGQMKNNMIKKLLNLNEKHKIHKNLYDLKDSEIYKDQLNLKAGLLFRVLLSNEEQLQKRFEGENCKNCQIMKSLEDFQVNTIPEVFKNFCKKLEKESSLETFFKTSMNVLKSSINFKHIFSELWEIFKDLFRDYNLYIEELIEKIRFYKTELSVYKDANKLKTLQNSDVDKIYKQIKKVYKVYQEEKIRRNLMQEMNTKVKLIEDQEEEEFKKQELKKFKTIWENIENVLKEKIEAFQNRKIQSLNNLDKEIIRISNDLTNYIDNIYEDNYNIQKYLFNYHKENEKKYKFYEKKIKWLKENTNNKMQKEDKHKENLSQCMSEGRLSTISQVNNNKKIKNDNDQFKQYLVFEKLNKRLDQISGFQENLQQIKDMKQKSLILDNSDVDALWINTMNQIQTKTSEEEIQQIFLQSDLHNNASKNRKNFENELKKIPNELPQVLPILNQISEKAIHPSKEYNSMQNINTQKDRFSSKFDQYFENISKQKDWNETSNQKVEEKQRNLKFDILNYLNQNVNMKIDIDKYKINRIADDSQTEDKIPFDQIQTPIELKSSTNNSFLVNKTMEELEQKLWSHEPESQKNKNPPLKQNDPYKKYEPVKTSSRNILQQYFTQKTPRSISKNLKKS